MNGNVIRTITIRGQSEGLDKLTADVNKLAAAQENVAVVSEQTAKRTLSLEDAWKRQTLRLDEAARAQANIARETKLADAALREGLATQAQHAQRLEQINQRYGTYGKAVQQSTGETRLARHELINLSRQFQDVGVGLASGQSPFTILVQQGAQIADVFATSSGTLRGFFSQAIGWAKGFLTSTTGILTVFGAVAAAAAYAAYQFTKSSTTIKEALEEQNRLMTIGYDLHSQRLLLVNNEIDLQAKLAVEMQKVASIAERRASTPTSVAGEMGEFSGAYQALPGYEKLINAVQTLNVAIAQGQPGFAQFNSAISQISTAEPGVKATIAELLKVGEVGVQLEEQAAKVGRIAQLTQELAQKYPGITSETAKQLEILDAQLKVAQARGEQEKIIAQELLEQTKLRLDGIRLDEAALIAAGKRAIAEANVNKVMEDRLELWKEEQIKAEGLWEAGEKHNRDEKAALRDQATAKDNQRPKTTEQLEYEEEILKAEQNQGTAIRQNGVAIQQNIGYVQQLNREVYKTAAEWFWLGNAMNMVPTQFGDEKFETEYDPLYVLPRYREMQAQYGAGNVEMADVGDVYGSKEPRLTQAYIDQQNQAALAAHAAGYDVSSPTAIQKSFENALSVYGAKDMGTLDRLINVADQTQQASLIQQTIDHIRKTEPAGLAREEMIQTLNDRLAGLTQSTDSLNSTMQSALSPYYSQDPRTTKLGFRAGVTGNPDWMTGATNANPLVAILGQGATAPGMAGGGSFVVGGGYSANDNRMAVFPVASGEEVIVNRNKGGRGTQMVNIDNRIIVNGSLDADTMGKLKISRFQQSQRMRAGMARG